jgi:PKD repeat protein
MYTIVLTAENMMGMDVCFGTVSIEGIEAGFTSNSPVALGSPVVFTNTTLANPAVITWMWDLGDSTVSTAQTPPPHVYPGEGSYTVTLSAVSIKGSSTYTGTAMVVAFWPHHIYLPITLRQ